MQVHRSAFHAHLFARDDANRSRRNALNSTPPSVPLPAQPADGFVELFERAVMDLDPTSASPLLDPNRETETIGKGAFDRAGVGTGRPGQNSASPWVRSAARQRFGLPHVQAPRHDVAA